MDNSTVRAPEKQTATRPPTTMTAEQRHSMIEWAWHYAQPTIKQWQRKWPGPDWSGATALRITRFIDEFDAGRSLLRTWAQQHANFACQDLSREDTGTIRFARTVPAERRAKVYPFQAFEFVDDDGRTSVPDCLAVRDRQGPLERIDGLRSLLVGASQTERLVAIGYYSEGQTMKQIGRSLGLSESRVSQIHSGFLDRIRERLEAIDAA